MTKIFNFTLTFSLLRYDSNLENYLDALFEADCDDAIVGTGMPGSIALNFSRSAKSAEDAIQQAVANVRKAIPDAEFTELKPG